VIESLAMGFVDRRQELPHFRTGCAPSNQAKSMFLNRNSAIFS